MFNVLVIAGAIVVLPLAIYFSAYFACTKSWGKVNGNGEACRVYDSCWQSLIFMPAAGVESKLTGRQIHTACFISRLK